MNPTLAVLIAELREARFPADGCCPHCGSRSLTRWGRFSGRQRYRCRSCGRTSSDFTGTPLCYSKLPALWPHYAECLIESISVRAAAARIGIDKDTAWRWRHRLLQAWGGSNPRTIRGAVEVFERRLPIYDCSRRESWESRQPRAIRFPGLRVILARDEAAALACYVIRSRRATVRDYEALLEVPSKEISFMIGVGGRASPAARFARVHEIEYGWHRSWARRGAPMSPRPRIRLRRCALRLRMWLRRFRGVAARHFATYLHWHRFLDARDPPARRLLLEAQRAPPSS